MRGATDEEQAAYASGEGRVIFSQDRDFPRIRSVPHAGLAYCDMDTRGVGEIIDGLVLIWEACEPDEMNGRVEYL